MNKEELRIAVTMHANRVRQLVVELKALPPSEVQKRTDAAYAMIERVDLLARRALELAEMVKGDSK